MRRKRIVGVAVVAAATAATMLATATGALAAPGNCTTSWTDRQATSLCTTGTGHHQVVVLIHHPNPEIGRNVVAGNWAAVGQVSTASLPGWIVDSVWVNKTDT